MARTDAPACVKRWSRRIALVACAATCCFCATSTALGQAIGEMGKTREAIMGNAGDPYVVPLEPHDRTGEIPEWENEASSVLSEAKATRLLIEELCKIGAVLIGMGMAHAIFRNVRL